MKFFFCIVLYILPLIGIAQQSFILDYQNLLDKVNVDGEVNYAVAKANLNLIERLYAQLPQLPTDEIASLINAYNFVIIHQISKEYPIRSVKEIKGFFKNKHTIGRLRVSLDELEELILDKTNNDGRIHMALVCGAKDCPPLFPEAFTSSLLDSQLTNHTTYSLTKPNIVYIFEESEVIIASKIFQWYSDDIGDLFQFYNQYTENNLPNYPIKYADYDWNLNDYSENNINSEGQELRLDNNESELRYFASNLYAEGEYEVNWFNNYYSQVTPTEGFDLRENFFSSFLQFLYGYNKNLNIGLDLKFRSVSSGPTQTNPIFQALRFKNQDRQSTKYGNLSQSQRYGLTQVGPRLKYQPFRQIAGLTFQHALYIPIVLNSEGNGQQQYIDWGSPSIYTDIFYDKELTQRTSLFIQLGLYGENFGGSLFANEDGYYQLATPITVILNYFATNKTTIYSLINSAPQFGFSVAEGTTSILPNHYNQYGIGIKYFLTNRIQVEGLTTVFSSVVQGRRAATYNIGMRYYGW